MNLSSAAESKIEKLYHEVNVFRKLFQISLTDFLSLSVEEKSRLLKRFLRDHRSDSDMWLWYMGLRDSELLEIIMESVDEKWKQLDKKEIMTRIFAEMPEIISKVDYSSLRHFMVREYKCWGPVKDVFTAGRNSSKELYPKKFMHLLERLNDIKKYLLQANYDIEKWKDEAMFYVTDRIGKSGNANGLTEKQAKEIIQKIKAI